MHIGNNCTALTWNPLDIPVIKTVKDIDEGQEITIKYSANSYYPVAIAY